MTTVGRLSTRLEAITRRGSGNDSYLDLPRVVDVSSWGLSMDEAGEAVRSAVAAWRERHPGVPLPAGWGLLVVPGVASEKEFEELARAERRHQLEHETADR